MKFTFSVENGEKLTATLTGADNWSPVPMPEIVESLLYNADYEGRKVGYNHAIDVPYIEIGYYFFYDEQTETYAPRRDLLTDSSSFNFRIAAFDCDGLMMYYYELDT